MSTPPKFSTQNYHSIICRNRTMPFWIKRQSSPIGDDCLVAGGAQKKSRVTRDSFERKTGLGPATSTLARLRSTN